MESQHGTELVRGAVYEFHKPDPGERIQVEIVFMHGLQVSAANLKDAYYKTWRTADGKEIWPETWLKDKFPNARILSLAYDSSAQKTRALGNMSPYLLGESLLDEMVSTEANIGQNDCPVVIVGHSLGGLIAKEIVVRCRNSSCDNMKYQNLLHNLKAIFFYATPHGGSDLAASWISKIADWFPFIDKSSLVEYLKPKGTDRTHTQRDFLKAINKDCKFYVVAEGQKSKISGLSWWIVRENSASFPGPHEFVMHKDANHMTVCKPQSTNDIGYLKLIECINQVIEEYKRRITVDLSVDPIGIGGTINKISELLERPEVLMVGLFGMGGIGKTTLSKVFYNLNAFKYAKSCYLENVTSKGVLAVQKELFRGLCGHQLSQDEHVEALHVEKIKDCFLTQKILVVIDDVSSKEHLEKLQVFHALETGSQSKVLVTGQNKGIMPKKYLNSGKAIIEPINGISKGFDLKLFLRYAFDGIPEDDKEQVEIELFGEAQKIVQLCDGLPLSLEVLGKYLANSRDEDEDLKQWKRTWVEAYERLERAQTMDGSKDDKLWSSLRISYDHLADFEQKMFLDFACIFSEGFKVKKKFVERIWDSPMGVKNLLDRSLLKVEDGRFVMHNQWRDMGRHLLLKETLSQHPIYLWKKFTKQSDVPYIASIEQEVGKRLWQYSKLRFFVVDGCDEPSLVNDCLLQCSGDLRWLYLGYCSSVTKIGIQELGGLRVLQISNCNNMVELPEAIGKLMNLVEIKVSDCPNLQSLPNTVGNLKNLKKLVIARSGLQVVPDSVGELPEVEHLSFEGCQHLREILGTQICTKNLKKLKLPIVPTNLRPCPQLQRLHIGKGQLQCLHIGKGVLRLFHIGKDLLRRVFIGKGQGMTQFFQELFKIDYVPKLERVWWWNQDSVEVKVQNPDGSELVLKNWSSGYTDLRVRRNEDGSISRLIEVWAFYSFGDISNLFYSLDDAPIPRMNNPCYDVPPPIPGSP